MSSELSVLALYGLLVIATILLQVILAVPQVGLPYLSSARDDQRPLSGVAARAVRTVENSVVAMALFAPAILLLEATNGFTATTLLAAQIFLIARLAFVCCLSLGGSIRAHSYLDCWISLDGLLVFAVGLRPKNHNNHRRPLGKIRVRRRFNQIPPRLIARRRGQSFQHRGLSPARRTLLLAWRLHSA